MGLREAINKQKPATKAGVVACLFAVAGFALWTSLSSGKPHNAMDAYYTTDDGQTTFVDDFFRPYPFDHDGKPAYRVYMYQTSKGKKFVGFIERYTDSGLKALEPLLSQNISREALRTAIQGVRDKYSQVKKPNDPTAKWYAANTKGAENVEKPAPPDGPDDNCILVFP